MTGRVFVWALLAAMVLPAGAMNAQQTTAARGKPMPTATVAEEAATASDQIESEDQEQAEWEVLDADVTRLVASTGEDYCLPRVGQTVAAAQAGALRMMDSRMAHEREHLKWWDGRRGSTTTVGRGYVPLRDAVAKQLDAAREEKEDMIRRQRTLRGEVTTEAKAAQQELIDLKDRQLEAIGKRLREIDLAMQLTQTEGQLASRYVAVISHLLIVLTHERDHYTAYYERQRAALSLRCVGGTNQKPNTERRSPAPGQTVLR